MREQAAARAAAASAEVAARSETTARAASLQPATIWDSIVRHAGAAARPAVAVDGQEVLTYGVLGTRVDAAAAALRRTGLLAGQDPRVAILLAPGAAFVEAFLAAGAAGAAAMVLHHGWSDRDLAYALAAGRPALALSAADDAPRVARHLPAGTVVAVDGREAVDGHVAPALTTAADVCRTDTAAATAGVCDVGGRAPFYVGFTSGSTGRPKGFVRSHRSWLASFTASAAFGFRAGDRVLAPGPLDHSLFLYAAVHALSVGATAHLRRRFVPGAVLDAIARERITRLYLVPTMLTALLRAAEHRGRPRFPHVRTLLCSGARWPAATLERAREVFPHADPIDFYGASETSFVSMRRPVSGDAASDVGQPFPGVEVSVRRGDGTTAATGETGRLWVRSAMLFSGYLDAPAERDADGWLTIGDLAHVDVRGRLHLVGREHGMLVCGGVNVYPEEIEAVLTELPEVAEAAVTGIPHAYWGDLICAVVRWHDGRRLPRRELRAHCAARLERGKRPQRWLAVDAIPRTASGKVARDVLARRVRAGLAGAAEVL